MIGIKMPNGMHEQARLDSWRGRINPQTICGFLEGRWAVVIPVCVFAYCAYQNSGQWSCIDDPLTFWVSMGASSWADVARRSPFNHRLPTYFWITRLFGECCGGLEGIRLSSQLFWLATVCWVFFLLRRLEPQGIVGLLCAITLSYVTPLAWFYSCGRPYPALVFFTVMALQGLVLIYQGRAKLGCLLVALGSGLSTHMLLFTIPTGLAIMALAGFLLIRRREPLSAWFVLATVSLCLLAPVLAQAVAMLMWGRRIGWSQFSWAKGVPRSPLAIVLSVGLGLSVILFRRLKLLNPPSSYATSDPAVLWLTFLALIFPCVSLFLYYLLGLNLFAPWYDVQVALLIVILGSLFLGTIRYRIPRVAVGAALTLGLAIFSGIVNAQIRAFLEPTAWRGPMFRYVMEHAANDDLVVVVSAWFESRFWYSYETPLGKSYLLADTMLVPGFEKLQAFPAPVGRTDADQTEPTPLRWAAAIRSMAKDHRRIWYVDSPSLETDSAKDRLNTEFSTIHSLSQVSSVIKFHGEDGWAFKQLLALGYRPVPDAVPPEFRKQLFALEKSSSN